MRGSSINSDGTRWGGTGGGPPLNSVGPFEGTKVFHCVCAHMTKFHTVQENCLITV